MVVSSFLRQLTFSDFHLSQAWVEAHCSLNGYPTWLDRWGANLGAWVILISRWLYRPQDRILVLNFWMESGVQSYRWHIERTFGALLSFLLLRETMSWILLICHLDGVSWGEGRFDWAVLTTRMRSLLHRYLSAVFHLRKHLALLDDSRIRFALQNLRLVLSLRFLKVSLH